MEALREKSFVWQKFFLNVRSHTLKQDADVIKRDKGPLVPSAEWIKTKRDAGHMFEPAWMRYQRGACMVAMLREDLPHQIVFYNTVQGKGGSNIFIFFFQF